MASANEEPRFVLRVAYDGSRFQGSQLQPDAPTVQRTIERALSGLCRDEPPRILAAGRTDRGVHATGQVVAVLGPVVPPPAKAVDLIDRRMAPHVRVVAWALARTDFNPRHAALSRTYRYVMRPGGTADPFCDPYSLAVDENLDWAAMQAAALSLVGTHSFTSFATTPSQQTRLERSLDAVDIKPTTASGRRVVEFRARAFLRGQVRNMMGTLLAVGRHELAPEAVATMLSAATKGPGPAPAPPDGLYLVEVAYGAECFLRPFESLPGREKALDRFFTA